MKTTSLYDEIITLIGTADSIDVDARLSMIQEIRTEGITPAMQERIMALFNTEFEGLGAGIDRAQSIIEKAMVIRGESDAATLPESKNVQAEFSGAADAVTNYLEIACSREAKTVYAAVGTAITKRDDDAADVVRQSLKM